MNKRAILDLLRIHKPVLAKRFDLFELALFGSSARNEANDQSDIDVLVSFTGPATSQRYFGVQFYLEDLLGKPVDLVTRKALRPEFQPTIERELIHV